MKKQKISDILNGKIDDKLLSRIDKIFSNDELFEDFLKNVNSAEVLKPFRILNRKISENDIKVSNNIAVKIERLSDKYVKLVHSKYIPSKILDNLDNNHNYSKEYRIIAEAIPLFSLKEVFSYENSKKCPYELNGVTLITPTRTISVFCQSYYDDIYGTGHHDTRFSQISKAVYCRNFENAQSGSDIQIRYVNKPIKDKQHTVNIVVGVPYPINSSQLKSLEYLNEEIKKYENNKKITLVVDTAVTDYFDNIHNNYDMKASTNLDILLQNVTVNNNIKNSVEQKYRLGYPNYENHYNDGNYKIFNEKNKKL